MWTAMEHGGCFHVEAILMNESPIQFIEDKIRLNNYTNYVND